MSDSQKTIESQSASNLIQQPDWPILAPKTTNAVAVVIHGVGEQAKLSTLQDFIRGYTQAANAPMALSRAQIAGKLESGGGRVKFEEHKWGFCEFNYSSLIRKHQKFAEKDPRSWVRSFEERVGELNKARRGPADQSFAEFGEIIDDVVFSTTLARFVAYRFHVPTAEISYTASQFIQQIQLYIEHEPYRKEIDQRFAAHMESLDAEEIILATHSLGTVVTFRGLLLAAREGKQWVRKIRRFVTFGSPIDLLLLMFRDLFQTTDMPHALGIEWVNYSFRNDPVATDLAIARASITRDCSGLFADNAPVEVDLGPGSVTTAHTDYWTSREMLSDIFKPATGGPVAHPDQQKKIRCDTYRPAATVFRHATWGTVALSAWLLVIWWEENLKHDDAHRLTALSNPVGMILTFAFFFCLIYAHVKAWTANYPVRILWFVLTSLFAIVMTMFLPGIAFLGGMFNPGDFEGYSKWDFGNLIVLLVPATAAHRLFRTTRGTKVDTGKSLVLLSLFLSVLVGTRNNPSNISAELGVLTLAFGVWWLAIVLARIDQAFRKFIGGREHLDILARIWKIPRIRRSFVSSIADAENSVICSEEEEPDAQRPRDRENHAPA